MTSRSKLFEFSHEDKVWCVKIVDKMVLSCGDRSVRIRNLEDGKLLYKLRLLGWCYNFDLNSEKTLLAVAHAGGVTIWDFTHILRIMEIELETILDVRFNEHGTTLILGHYDGEISRIDLY